MAPLAPSGDTVLAPKYHFHTNTEHYQQEVEEKAETSLTQPPKNPYCPLSDPAPLLRVPYTCPLLDATDGTKVCILFDLSLSLAHNNESRPNLSSVVMATLCLMKTTKSSTR